MESSIRNRKAAMEQEGGETEPLLTSQNSQEIIIHNGNSPSHNDTTDHRRPTIPLHMRTVRATVYVIFKALNIVYVPVFIYRAFQKPSKCTPVTDPVLRITAVELARKIRTREISCEKVIQSYITRIKEVNPLLNAVIEDRFSDALQDAKKVDAMLTSEEFTNDHDKIAQEYPLLGVPVSIKGSLAVKGMKHTSGTVIRKEHRAENDAVAVASVRKAGGIPLLVSNVPELCMSWETSNKLIGTTSNPHDTTRTCGGSSGGEASLLASGASVIGLGSDIAGSLRLPAHYCGVWGHKPTPGVVPFGGHYPSCPHRDQWESVFTVGPMARYATDLRVLLGVISEPEHLETLNLNKKINIRKIKIYYSEHEDYYWQKPNKHCQGALQKVIQHFKNVCDVQPQKIDFHLYPNTPDMASFHLLGIEDIEDIFDGSESGVYTELLRYTTFRSKHTFMAIACGLLRKIAASLSEKQKGRIKKWLAKLRKHHEEILKDDGVLIVPSFPVEAPKHGDVLRTAIFAGYMSMFNWLGFPVTNCPVEVSEDGLPVGVQVACRPFGDNLTFTVAEEIERAFGGWIEPGGMA